MQKEMFMKTRIINWAHIITFLLLSYALFWIPFILTKISYLSGNNFTNVILGILGPYSPLLAAIIVRSFISKEGYKDVHLGIKNTAIHYWFLALLLPFFWNGIQDTLHIIFGFSTVNPNEILPNLYRIPINLFGGLIIFIGEEFGWRSYLVEKLRPLGRWKALLISGVFWSLWHLPFLIYAYGGSIIYLKIIGVLVSLFIYVLLGFIFGWLYLESKSIWPCVLMHSYNNLITMNLLNWEVNTEPTLLQNALIALIPILIVWIALYYKGKFKGDA